MAACEKASRTGSVCFVSLTSFAALAGPAPGTMLGGAEVQQALIARGLRDRGYRVSFVTYDHGQADGAEFDGIRVYKAFAPEAGLWGVRFVHPRWTGLCAAMRRANANVYYQRTAGSETGQVCAWCRRHGKRFVFASASDSDVDPALPWLKPVERWLYRYALERADDVVVQTQSQQQAMKQAFGRLATVIPSCAPADTSGSDNGASPHALSGNGVPHVLWAGRLIAAKRPLWCLEVAAQCPAVHFDIVGKANDAVTEQELHRRAQALPNVTLHGAVGYEQMGRFYRQSKVLLCTSETEGFPNTFLEAWTAGRPVVTTVDPDGAVVKSSLGRVGRTPQELAAALQSLLGEPIRWQAAAQSARAYVQANHSVQRLMPAYEAILGL